MMLFNCLHKINLSVLKKISYYLVFIWVLTPIEMIFFTPILGKDFALDLMFIILLIIGFLGIFMFVIHIIKNKYKKEHIKKYLCILIFIVLLSWCLITCFVSIDPKLSIVGDSYRKEGLITYFAYFGIFCLALFLKNDKYKLKIFNLLIIVEVIISFIVLLDNDITFLLMSNQGTFTGVFSQFNHYGYYLMFGILVSLFMFFYNKSKLKYLYFIAYCLLLYTLLMNDTFGCILAIIATLILILIFIKVNIKEKIFVFLSIVILFTFTSKNGQNIIYKNFESLFIDLNLIYESIYDVDKFDSVGTSRGELWKQAICYIKEKPITGHGIESLLPLYFDDDIPQDRPHNILIQFATFTGLPGLILYLLFIFSIMYKGVYILKKSTLLSFFVFSVCLCYFMSSMFGNSMFYTSPYFLIFLGFLVNVKQNELI